MGIDEQSKGVRVYWPDKTTVGVERNVYYDRSIASVSCLEGEEGGIIETKTDSSKEIPPKILPLLTFLALHQLLNLKFKPPNTLANPVNAYLTLLKGAVYLLDDRLIWLSLVVFSCLL